MTDNVVTPPPESIQTERRTRRAVLAGAAGSLTGLFIARLGVADPVAAAAGDPLILGSTSNTAGSSNTTLATTSSGTALLVTQSGTGTALRGSAIGPNSIAGFFTATNGTGISGVTGRNSSSGAYAGNDAPTFGGGAAVRASGQQNHGLIASASGLQADGVQALHTGNGTAIRATASAGMAMQAVGQTGVTAEATGDSANGLLGHASGGGTSSGVLGTALSASGTGVKGIAQRVNGATTGVHGEASSSAGVAVRALATSLAGGTEGVRAEVASPDGIGIHAISTAVTGSTTAVVATTASTSGIGVYASASATTGQAFGVVGETHSVPPDASLAAGVWGHSGASTGGGVGVFGQTLSTDDDAAGVLGWAFTETGSAVGVRGISSSGDGIGVLGLASHSPGIGVFGSAIGNGLGIYSLGDAQVDGSLDVNGTLTKSGGSFKIDHPLDPANKFLSHSFVESPDMKNIYDGVVKLDGDGAATVDLPDWFEALNRDMRYQLTPIGEYAPLFIRSKVIAGRFSIAGGVAGQEVSWQVTGIRKDAWAEVHRIPVEEKKTGEVKGHYLHPKEHGKDAAKGIKSPAAARRAIAKPPKAPTPPA